MINDLLTEFTNDLKSHDWFYDYSDDHSVWNRGRNERKQLQNVANTLVNTKQASADEVAKLWNTYAPDRFQSKPTNFDKTKPKRVRVFKNKTYRPTMGEIVKLKKDLQISTSEANFRLKYGVEPSDYEKSVAKTSDGRFFFHWNSHPELWEWKNN